MLGLKGDLVFQAKACSLVRNYARVQKHVKSTTSKPLVGLCCWRMAGTDKFGFENFGRNPGWIETTGMNNPVPWEESPTILRSIPHAADATSFLKVDLFHTLNLGVYKDFSASSLVLVLQFMAGNNNEERMLSMNAHLQVYLRQTRQRLHCQKLTLENIGAKSKATSLLDPGAKGRTVWCPWIFFLLDTVNARARIL